jgi:hypothetical protein
MSDWSKQMRAARKDIESKLTDVFKEECRITASSVIEATPVDTGNASANWYSSKDKPSTRINYKYFTQDLSPEEGKFESRMRANKTLAGIKLGQTFYLTNNVDYINELEAGKSNQATQGMLFVAADYAKQRINNK